jgi:hypothetical protein
MAPHEIAALQAQVNDLDRDTARRVARLVVECRVSLRLALLAVQDADRINAKRSVPQPDRTKPLGRRWLSYWRSVA